MKSINNGFKRHIKTNNPFEGFLGGLGLFFGHMFLESLFEGLFH